MSIDQNTINVLLALCGAFGGWYLKASWDAIKELQKDGKDLVDRIAAVEVLVAGTYVKRDDLNNLVQAIFAKLDRIEDKMDGKADKP